MKRVQTAVRLVIAAGAIGWAAAAAAQTDAPTPQQPASQTPSSKRTGECYMPDANGKQVLVPNCGDPDAGFSPADRKQVTPAQPADPAKDFHFPGESSSGDAAKPNSGQTNAPAPAGGSNPAQAFPFPGENSAPLSEPNEKPPLRDAGSSGDATSSSSSSSSSSDSGLSGLPDDPNTKGPLADDDTIIKKPRKKLPPVVVQTEADRVSEDLGVYGFYMADNNFRGAYLRATDAVTHAPDDPNAHFALAEVSRKLGKLDEALSEYKKTLTLDPIPKDKKAAEKAVKEMSGKE